MTQERKAAATVQMRHLRSNINLRIYQATVRREKKDILSALANVEERAARIAAGATDLIGVISALLEENHQKDEQIVKLVSESKQKQKTIDALQCASALVQLHQS